MTAQMEGLTDMPGPVRDAKIPVSEVTRISRSVARAQPGNLAVLAVMPIEGGADRVEIFVATGSHRSGPSRVSLIVDRSVSRPEFERDLAQSLREVFPAE
jgi:hypothetical protein